MAKKQYFFMSITQSDFDATINARNVILPDYIAQEKSILMVVAACPGYTQRRFWTYYPLQSMFIQYPILLDCLTKMAMQIIPR